MSAAGSGEPALRRLASFAAGLDGQGLPPAVIARLRTALADVIWGCLHFHHDARAMAALRAVPLDAPGARCAILTTGHRGFAADAAFLNALACAATDRSDTHLPTATHPGIVVIPAVLAAVQERGGTSADLLRGIVCGYEIMGRLARILMRPGFAATFRPTAVAGPVAAAMAAAAALRLAPDGIAAAGSLAANTAMGLNEWARAGTGEHVFHAAVAARNGVTCAFLAEGGFAAADTALDGVSGMLAAYGVRDRLAGQLDDLGRRFEMLEIAFKPVPACFFAQTPVQAASAFGRPLDPDDIVRVDIGVSSTAANYPGCANSGPIATFQDAVMSIPFAVAATLIAGGPDGQAWMRHADPAILSLAARCLVRADPELTAASPARSGCTLSVEMADGSVLTSRRDDFVSMRHDEVCARLREDGERWLGPAATERLMQAIEALDTIPDLPRRLAEVSARPAAIAGASP